MQKQQQQRSRGLGIFSVAMRASIKDDAQVKVLRIRRDVGWRRMCPLYAQFAACYQHTSRATISTTSWLVAVTIVDVLLALLMLLLWYMCVFHVVSWCLGLIGKFVASTRCSFCYFLLKSDLIVHMTTAQSTTRPFNYTVASLNPCFQAPLVTSNLYNHSNQVLFGCIHCI